MQSSRSSLNIMLSVWRALFLREALGRLFSARAAWFWQLANPVFHVAYLLFIFTMGRIHSVGGFDTALWIVAGLQSFFMFQRTATQVGNAISANQALFAYRQVKPVDTTLVRAALEGLLVLIVTVILLSGLALFGHQVLPADPLAVIEALFGLWLLGIGLGLITSVAAHLIPELDRIVNLIMMPMYLISGVMFPLSAIPSPYREWLLLNPVSHGLEAARLGFAPYYHAVPELSIAYIYACAVVTIFVGLALHRRFAQRLLTQ